jgi:hypothetical protein
VAWRGRAASNAALDWVALVSPLLGQAGALPHYSGSQPADAVWQVAGEGHVGSGQAGMGKKRMAGTRSGEECSSGHLVVAQVAGSGRHAWAKQ